MQKRERTEIITMLLGFVVIIASAYSFRGRAIEQWYIWKLDSEEESTRVAAIARLGEMRSLRAVPKLLALPGEGAMRIHFPIDGRPPYFSFGQLSGPQEEVDPVFDALSRIGDAAVPELVDSLDDSRKHVRETAAVALCNMGSRARPAIPRLIQILDTRDPARGAACVILCQLGPEGAEAIPSLRKILGSGRSPERQMACMALQYMGAKAGPAVPDLLRLLSRPEGSYRTEAASALAAIAPENPEVISALTEAAKSEDRMLRQAAEKALDRNQEGLDASKE